MRRLAGLLLAVAALVGPPAVATAGSLPLKQNTIPGFGVSVQVPQSWVKAPASALSKPIVYASLATTTHEGFRVNLNLIATKADPSLSLHDWLVMTGGSVYIKSGKLTPVTINDVDGFRYESTKLIAIASKRLLSLQYAFEAHGRFYVFTYSALATDRARIFDTLEASAHTIRFAA